MLKTDKSFERYDYRSSCTFYLFAIVVVLVAQAIGSGVGAALQFAFPDVDVTASGDFNGAFMICIQSLSCVFIFVYSHCMRKKFNFTIAKREDGGATIALQVILPMICAVILFIGMYLPTVWYGVILHLIGVPAEFGALRLDTVSSVVMIVIATVFLAPVFEEFIYRGVLLHGLRDRKSTVAAVMLSALAFMLMHMNPLQTIFQFALGVLAAFIVLKTGRLLPAMILHASSNAIALALQETALSNVAVSCVQWLVQDIPHLLIALAITVGFLAAAGALLFVIVKYVFDLPKRIKDKRKKKDNENAENAENVDNADNAVDKKASGSVSEKSVGVEPYEDESDGARALRETIAKRNSGTGTMMYWIAAGLSIAMLIMNLVAAIVSGVLT